MDSLPLSGTQQTWKQNFKGCGAPSGAPSHNATFAVECHGDLALVPGSLVSGIVCVRDPGEGSQKVLHG